jgi:hypothetical protein
MRQFLRNAAGLSLVVAGLVIATSPSTFATNISSARCTASTAGGGAPCNGLFTPYPGAACLGFIPNCGGPCDRCDAGTPPTENYCYTSSSVDECEPVEGPPPDCGTVKRKTCGNPPIGFKACQCPSQGGTGTQTCGPIRCTA